MKTTLNKRCSSRFYNSTRLPLRILVCFGIPFLSYTGRAQSLQVIHGLVPPVTAGLQSSAPLQPTQQVNLAISLPLRNHTDLLALIEQRYDPTSTNYQQYLNPEQFADAFGPTTNDYAALITFAQANNLTVTATHPNRTLLDVSGSAADIENAMHVKLLVYQHPTEARTFYAPDADPALDLAVPILNIDGLDNYNLPRPCLSVRRASSPSGHRPDQDPKWLLYMGPDFRTAYAPGTSLTGSGQTVALVEFNGYFIADIEAYEAAANMTDVPVNFVNVNGFQGPGPTNDANAFLENQEVSVDIELAIAMAPGLSRVLVYEAPERLASSPSAILTKIADDDLASQISCSWTWGSAAFTNSITACEQIFQQFAAQGQSFFQASGDTAAYNDAFGGTNAIPYPADSCWVTSVGGTDLNTIDATGSWESETNWNWSSFIGRLDGSSGGISTRFGIPLWQQGISMTANMGSTTMRNIPDVAMVADWVLAFSNNGGNWIPGEPYDITPGAYLGQGTSCSAPLWAGFTALINQKRLALSQPPGGFMNYSLYAAGKTVGSAFHDIVVGGNNWNPGSTTRFPAVSGYDLCTGWGTPNGVATILALSGQIGGIPPGMVDMWEGENNPNSFYGYNDGVAEGESLNYSPGEVGMAFNTAIGYVWVPNGGDLNVGIGSGFTVELWINPASLTSNQPIPSWSGGVTFEICNQTHGAGYGCLFTDIVDTQSVNHYVSSLGNVLTSSVFQHVALTYDQASGYVTLYLNGNPLTTTASGHPTSTYIGSITPQTAHDLYLGWEHLGSGGFLWDGLLDEVSLYNRALAPGEIYLIYRNGRFGK